MAIRIITDSSADYTIEEIKEKSIELVPLNVSFGDKHYIDRINITTEEFFRRLAESREFPKTAQPSPAAFLEHFEKAKESGDQVVAILLSGKLSGTVQSAQIAKHMCEYDGIHIVDSKLVTAGLKILVDKAVEMRSAGDSAESIVKCVEALKDRVFIRAAVDTLEYLYKGGRLTKLQAGLGIVAGIKPVLTVDEEGKVVVCGKVRGKCKACQSLIKSLKENTRDEKYPIYFLYSADDSNCRDLMDKISAEGIEIKNDILTSIGPAIGAHVGSGAFGVAYVI